MQENKLITQAEALYLLIRVNERNIDNPVLTTRVRTALDDLIEYLKEDHDGE